MVSNFLVCIEMKSKLFPDKIYEDKIEYVEDHDDFDRAENKDLYIDIMRSQKIFNVDIHGFYLKESNTIIAVIILENLETFIEFSKERKEIYNKYLGRDPIINDYTEIMNSELIYIKHNIDEISNFLNEKLIKLEDRYFLEYIEKIKIDYTNISDEKFISIMKGE